VTIIEGIIEVVHFKNAEHTKERKQRDEHPGRKKKDITQFPDCHDLSIGTTAIIPGQAPLFSFFPKGTSDPNRFGVYGVPGCCWSAHQPKMSSFLKENSGIEKMSGVQLPPGSQFSRLAFPLQLDSSITLPAH
jgi:hypothetical protein